MTKITAVAPGGDCPLWRGFIKRITNDNEDLAAFLQRIGGYGLTGITNEHALFFLHGSGGNGKSVFTNTLVNILGDYHRRAPMEVFTASGSDRHPTELAMLQGARLVTAVEVEEGRAWAESKIKAMTGGDRIAARYMRQDFFEYDPQFKLMTAGNHKPSLRSVDDAIRRRMHLIPFEATISEDERDTKLEEKLKGELPGILSWLVEGCLAWQATGLQPPPIVKMATEDYLETEDTLGAWFTEYCLLEADAWASVSDLFCSWEACAKASGENPGTKRAFSQRLEAHRFKRVARNGKRGFLGLKVIVPWPGTM